MMLQDSLAVFPPSAPLGWGLNLLLGLGASVGTALIARAGAAVDKATGSVDGRIRRGMGPALPAVAGGLSILLPLLGNAIGISNLPPADVVANAPLAALTGVIFREVGQKWVLPLFGGSSRKGAKR